MGIIIAGVGLKGLANLRLKGKEKGWETSVGSKVKVFGTIFRIK